MCSFFHLYGIALSYEFPQMQKLKAVFTPFKRSKYNGEQDDSCLRLKCIHCSVEKADAHTQTFDDLEESTRSVTNQFVQVNLTPSRIPRLITPSPSESIRFHSQNDVEQRAEREKFSPIFTKGSQTAVDSLDRNSPKKDLFLGNEKSKGNCGSESDGPASEPEYIFKAEELPFSSKALRARKARQKSQKSEHSKNNDSDRRNPSASPKLKTFKDRGDDSSPLSGIPVPVKSCERSKTYVFENRDLSQEKSCEEYISLRPNYKNDNRIYLRREKSLQDERSDEISTPKKLERSFKETDDDVFHEILEADSGAGMACGDCSASLS